MEDQLATDTEGNSRQLCLEDAEGNNFNATEEGAAAPSVSPICEGPEPQLNQAQWDQSQDSSEVSLYAGLSDPVPSKDEDEEGGSLYNLLVLSVGFFLIFSASNTVGEFVPSVLPDGLGDRSMLLNSFVQSLAVFAAPGVVATAGEARSMALAALAYVIYIGSLLTSLPLTVMAASALLGLGSSIVWVAQGSFLTRCCPPKLRGAYSGVFYCFYFASNILGNVGAYYAFRLLTLQSMFSLFAMVAMLGVLVLLQLTEFPVAIALEDSDEEPEEVDVATDLDGTIVDDLSSSEYEGSDLDVEGEEEMGDEEGSEEEEPDTYDDVSVESCPSNVTQRGHSLGGLRSRVTTLLIYSLLAPMSFYTGFEASFWSGQFTKLLPQESIGLVLAVTGVGEVIGALGLGLVSDSLGRRAPTFVLGSLLFLYGLYWCIPLYEATRTGELLQPTLLGAPVVAYVSSFAFGMGDGVFCGHMFAMISSLFSPEDLEAWALFNLLGTLGSASAFAYGIAAPLVGPHSSITQVWTQAGTLIIGTILYVVVDTLVVTWQRPEGADDPKKNM